MQTTSHTERIAAVAERYTQRGYQVVERPGVEQLPEFLQEFKPDLMAKNGSEAVIVEVQSYGQVAQSRDLEKLAASVESNPGWRLELVLDNPPDPAIHEGASAGDGRPTIGIPEIRSLIANSEILALAGASSAAVVLLWSALEAAIRTGLERIPASFINNESAAIIKQGVAYGLMDPEDYDVLSQLLPTRNAAAHGFTEAVDKGLLDKSTHIAKSILAEAKEM